MELLTKVTPALEQRVTIEISAKELLLMHLAVSDLSTHEARCILRTAGFDEVADWVNTGDRDLPYTIYKDTRAILEALGVTNL